MYTTPKEVSGMRQTDYKALYRDIHAVMKHFTPLRVDCGVLCGGACCKGDDVTGMRLFPHEESPLPVIEENGVRLVVCNGHCDREARPLACRIFPFFPTIDEKGRIFVETDDRALRLCPLLTHSDEIVFDRRFFRAVKKVGKLLAKDADCRAFLAESTAEIDMYRAFLRKE